MNRKQKNTVNNSEEIIITQNEELKITESNQNGEKNYKKEDITEINADTNAEINADTNAEINADTNAEINADTNAEVNAETAEPEVIEEVKIDEKIDIEITKDKMMAIVSFVNLEGAGEKLTNDQIDMAIRSKEIVYGIDEEVLNEIKESRVYNYKYVLAKGLSPIEGKEATINYKYDRKELTNFRPKVSDTGYVDYKDLNIVTNVRVGDVLAIKVPKVEGIDGKNVKGDDVKAAKKKDIVLPRGKGTKILEDELTLVAEIDGKLCDDGKKTSVVKLLEIKNDVSASTGNIDFVGDVIVNGNVQDGFAVKASGTIEIKGTVYASIIESDRNVIIHQGVQGRKRGCIKSKGNIIAKFLENVEVDSEGTVIAEAIMHSKVNANRIEAVNGKGLIVGGNIIATNKIDANIIGSSMETYTFIQIGIAPNLLKLVKEVDEKYNAITREINENSKGIKYLMSLQNADKERKQKLLTQLLNKKLLLDYQYNDIKKLKEEIHQKLIGMDKGKVIINQTLHAGVRIFIGETRRRIHDTRATCKLEKVVENIEIIY